MSSTVCFKPVAARRLSLQVNMVTAEFWEPRKAHCGENRYSIKDMAYLDLALFNSSEIPVEGVPHHTVNMGNVASTLFPRLCADQVYPRDACPAHGLHGGCK